jgi:hypothetical protein
MQKYYVVLFLRYELPTTHYQILQKKTLLYNG